MRSAARNLEGRYFEVRTRMSLRYQTAYLRSLSPCRERRIEALCEMNRIARDEAALDRLIEGPFDETAEAHFRLIEKKYVGGNTDEPRD